MNEIPKTQTEANINSSEVNQSTGKKISLIEDAKRIRIQNKVLGFKYILLQLVKSYLGKTNLQTALTEDEIALFNRNNDFDMLKVLKLLFFVCAVGDIKADTKLLSTFDRFVAMPFGPVELDIYETIKNGELEITSIDINKTILNNAIPNIDIGEEIRTHIDNAIEVLLGLSSKIVKYTQWELVDISHKWACWDFAMNIAYSRNKKQERMDRELILQDIECPLTIN